MKKICICLVFLLSVSCLFAEKIIFSADSMTGKSDDKNGETNLVGNAYIKTETMEIKADSILLSGEDYRFIKAEGTVSGVNSQSHMEFTCDTMTFDRTTKIAALEGNVNLTDKDNDVKASAQIIEYDQENDVAVLQIKVNLTQKDNVCSGAYAVYQKKEQLLELSGNAQIKKNNDTFRAQLITLNMETQDINLDGNVKGSITESSKQKSEDKVEAEDGKEKSKEKNPDDKQKSETENDADEKKQKPEEDFDTESENELK